MCCPPVRQMPSCHLAVGAAAAAVVSAIAAGNERFRAGCIKVRVKQRAEETNAAAALTANAAATEAAHEQLAGECVTVRAQSAQETKMPACIQSSIDWRDPNLGFLPIWVGLVAGRFLTKRFHVRTARLRLGSPTALQAVLKGTKKDLDNLSVDARRLFAPFVEETEYKLKDYEQFRMHFSAATCDDAFQYAMKKTKFEATIDEHQKMLRSLSEYRSMLPLFHRARLVFGLTTTNTDQESASVILFSQMAEQARARKRSIDSVDSPDLIYWTKRSYQSAIKIAGQEKVDSKRWSSNDTRAVKALYGEVFDLNHKLENIGGMINRLQVSNVVISAGAFANGGLAIRSGSTLGLACHFCVGSMAYVYHGENKAHITQFRDELTQLQRERQAKKKVLQEILTLPKNEWFAAVMPDIDDESTTMSVEEAVSLAQKKLF